MAATPLNRAQTITLESKVIGQTQIPSSNARAYAGRQIAIDWILVYARARANAKGKDSRSLELFRLRACTRSHEGSAGAPRERKAREAQ